MLTAQMQAASKFPRPGCKADRHGTRSVGSQLSAGGRQRPLGSMQSAKGWGQETRETVEDGNEDESWGLISQAPASAHACPVLHALPVLALVWASLQQLCAVLRCAVLAPCTDCTCPGFCMRHGFSTTLACTAPCNARAKHSPSRNSLRMGSYGNCMSNLQARALLRGLQRLAFEIDHLDLV